MLKFKIYNTNPKGRKIGDCVIRAIAYASCKSWDDTFKGLNEIALKIKSVANCKDTYEKYLNNIGFEKHKQPRKYDNTKYLVKEIEKIIDLNEYDVVISIAGHLTTIDRIDNQSYLIDIWDCGNKTICNYYTRRKVKNSCRPQNNAKDKDKKAIL